MGVLGWDRLQAERELELERSIVSNVPTSFPTSLELQPTNKCNIDCFFCSSKQFRNDEFLPWETLERELAAAAAGGLKSLRLSGGGESLIYAKLRPLLDLMKRVGIRLSDVTTNATPLAPVAKQIVDVGLDYASISLNEPTAELYGPTMRTNARMFDKAIEGIRAITAARDAAPEDQRPHVQLKFMFYKKNFRLARRMLEIGRELGADQVMLNQIVGLPPEERMSESEIAEAREILQEIIADDCATGAPLLTFALEQEGDLQAVAMRSVGKHMPERFAREEEVQHKPGRIRYCMMGWYHMTVAATGIVYPCCNFVGLPGKDIGNLHNQTLQEIWQGPKYTKFRDEFRWMMLLKGEAEHSKKYHQYLEPGCIAENDCPFSWGLCSARFYSKVSDSLERETGPLEKAGSHARNAILRGGHRVLSVVRPK